MPNHVHLIVLIQKDERAIRESPLRRSIISQLVGYLKMNVSKQIRQEDHADIISIWQRSYHDHIIRDEDDFLRIWQYIDENPLKWELDCFLLFNK